MSEIASSSSKAIENFENTLYTFNTDALQTAKDARRIENSTYTTLAKMDHIIFKANAYSAIFHGKTSHVFGDHHNCRLGLWYEMGLGKERFSHLPSYPKILEPHKIIHENVIENIKFIEDGDHIIENKDKLIANFKEMEVASDILFQTIDTLLSESGEV